MEVIVKAMEIQERNKRAAAYSAKCERKRARTRRYHQEAIEQALQIVAGICWMVAIAAGGYLMVLLA